MKSEEEENFEQSFTCGSKKRMYSCFYSASSTMRVTLRLWVFQVAQKHSKILDWVVPKKQQEGALFQNKLLFDTLI